MLAGEAVIAIWNGIEPAARTEFRAWHNTEHIPERVGIAGFLRGRRYVAADAATAPEFFTLYEVVNFPVVQGRDYRDRLDNPTARTRAVTAQFRDTRRALARVVESRGPGVGGMLLTLGFATDGVVIDPLRRVTREAAMGPGITGAHLCLTCAEASGVGSAESAGRSDIINPPGGIFLVEGISAESLTPFAPFFSRSLGGAPSSLRRGLYRLEYLREKAAFAA